MSGYKRFDRHEVFSMDDTSFVLDCINKTKWDKEDGAAELTNMLFGLFDGYYYDEIHKYAYEHLPEQMYEQLNKILKKVDATLVHFMKI